MQAPAARLTLDRRRRSRRRHVSTARRRGRRENARLLIGRDRVDVFEVFGDLAHQDPQSSIRT